MKRQGFLKSSPMYLLVLGMISAIGLFSCAEQDAEYLAKNSGEQGSAHESFSATDFSSLTVIDLIEQHQRAGRLDAHDSLVLKGMAILRPDLMPAPYNNPEFKPLKCGNPVLNTLLEKWESLTAEEQLLFSTAMARPNMQYYYDSAGGHFRIHYDTDGDDRVYQPDVDEDGDGVPDYVNLVAEVAEHCRLEETTTQGSINLDYNAPATDGTDGGGNDLYDLYLQHMGAYGVTVPAGSATDQYPGRNAQKSYILLDPTYAGFGYQTDRSLPLKVTLAHEYFHAIQFIYNTNATFFFWESGATWMEDVIYDDINDYYQYLRGRFKKPYKPLKDTNLMYGTCIWNHFLEQYFNNRNIIRSIWEEAISTSNIYDATDAVLQRDYGSTQLSAFQTYTQWNYLAGKNDDGAHYEEGAAWGDKMQNNEVWIAYDYSSSAYPVLQSQPTEAPEAMASNYYRFAVDQSREAFRVALEGDDTLAMGAGIIVLYDNQPALETTISLDSSNDGVYILDSLAHVTHVILIPQNLQKGGGGVATFWVRARYFTHSVPVPP